MVRTSGLRTLVSPFHWNQYIGQEWAVIEMRSALEDWTMKLKQTWLLAGQLDPTIAVKKWCPGMASNSQLRISFQPFPSNHLSETPAG